jgi:putative transposase
MSAPTSNATSDFNGESNHVHLLVDFPPKVALSKLFDSLKGVSS